MESIHSRALHARQRSRAKRDPAVFQPNGSLLASVAANSLKRKKSSDSASTGTAVTAPEDDRDQQGTTVGSSRVFVAPRRSRPRVEETRDTRSNRGSAKQVPFASGTVEEVSRGIIVGRKDKGKGVDRASTSSTSAHSRRSVVDFIELSTVGSSRDKSRERSDRNNYTGPLAHAEFERLKKEIEQWKQATADNKKVARKQAKKIEELKVQLNAESLAKKEQMSQVQNLKAKVEKRDELITSIEHSMQCQICMDLIDKPHALSPCGHVLCLHCLQEWFRKAPPSAEDSDMDPRELQDDPEYILNRPKSCPCCRAVVTQRPIPVFVIKTVATALGKYKAAIGTGPAARGRSPSPDGDDPWKGLFLESDDEGECILEESSDDDDGLYEDAMGWAMQGLHVGMPADRLLRALAEDSDSGSEDGDLDDDDDDGEGDDDSLDEDGSDAYENVYVAAQWEPPAVSVDPEEYVFRNEGMMESTLRMLRRGCTVDMIRIFKMSYSHSRGLVAHVRSLEEVSAFNEVQVLPNISSAQCNRIFLGWNIKVDATDDTGETYMLGILDDLRQNPARWMWTERANVRGAFDVKLLLRAEEVEEYDTTDTDVWLDTYDPFF